MTETGAARAQRRGRGDVGGGPAPQLPRLRRRLVRWYEDPRVTAAFQYTLREDDRFPTGLVTTDLTEAYPALEEWQAWGWTARPEPTAPPPPDTCS